MMVYGSMRHSFSGRKLSKKKSTGNVAGKYTPPPFQVYKPKETYRPDAGVVYNSVMTSRSTASRKENQKYTGTLVTGIATMHKSNAVPVINDEQAKELATMRRG